MIRRWSSRMSSAPLKQPFVVATPKDGLVSVTAVRLRLRPAFFRPGTNFLVRPLSAVRHSCLDRRQSVQTSNLRRNSHCLPHRNSFFYLAHQATPHSGNRSRIG